MYYQLMGRLELLLNGNMGIDNIVQYRYREQSVLYKHGGKSNECILPLECKSPLAEPASWALEIVSTHADLVKS